MLASPRVGPSLPSLALLADEFTTRTTERELTRDDYSFATSLIFRTFACLSRVDADRVRRPSTRGSSR